MRLQFGVAMFLVQSGSAQKTAVEGSGLWSSPLSWSPPGTPALEENVIIPPGSDIEFDASTPRLGYVDIQQGGSLRFQNGAASQSALLLQASSILVKGYFEIGCESSPLARMARINLIANSVPPSRLEETTDSLFLEPFGQKMIAVLGEGIWEAHGAGRTPMWTKVSATVSKGSTTLSLVDAVDWIVGDEIIITSTDFQTEQSERRFVTAVENTGAGSTVTIDLPLVYEHYGVTQEYFGFQVDMRAEVGVLSSNVVIEGDMEASPTSTPEPSIDTSDLTHLVQYGGHTIIVGAAKARIEGLEFRNMGQGGRMARYPVHWHRSRSALGQYVKRCSIHDSFSRGITVHDTNFLLVENNVVFNVAGHAVYLEDGTEEGNEFFNNLVVTTRPVGSSPNHYDTGSFVFPECGTPQPGVRLQFLDSQPAGFFITNANNTFVGNVAVGHDWGFWLRVDPVFSEPLFPQGCTTCCPDGRNCPCEANYEPPAVDSPAIAARRAILDETIHSYGIQFIDNVAHSNLRSGWWIKENWVPEVSQDLNIFDGFLAYKNSGGIVNYGFANIKMSRMILVDNPLGGHHSDWQRRGMHTLTDSLIMGESENFGNLNGLAEDEPSNVRQPDNGEFTGVLTSVTSSVFPTVERTYRTTNTWGHHGFRVSRGQTVLENVVFANLQPPVSMRESPSSNYVEDYQANNFIGALTFHKRARELAGPDRRISGVYFANSKVMTSFRGTRYSAQNKVDECLAPELAEAQGGTSDDYQTGLYDEDGSLPCSSPRAHWMSNSPDVVSFAECQLIQKSNAFYCPSTTNGYRYFGLQVNYQMGWRSIKVANALPVFSWECGKTIRPGAASDLRFTIRDDKQYTLRFLQSLSPTEEMTQEQFPDAFGLLFRTSGASTSFENLVWYNFGSYELVVKLPGKWTGSLFARNRDYALENSVDPATLNPGMVQAICSSDGFTWFKVTIKGPQQGPFASGILPEDGWELHVEKDPAMACSSAPDPFPTPQAPTGCPVEPTMSAIDINDPNSCPPRTPPAGTRPWVSRPLPTTGKGWVVDSSLLPEATCKLNGNPAPTMPTPIPTTSKLSGSFSRKSCFSVTMVIVLFLTVVFH